MTQHTPEPWGVFQDASGDVFVSSRETSFHVAEVGSEDDETVIPDASRIVACVNACVGVSNGELAMTTMSVVLARMNEAEQRCDEMLAELKQASTALSDAARQMKWVDISAAQAMLRSADAITKITGEPK